MNAWGPCVSCGETIAASCELAATCEGNSDLEVVRASLRRLASVRRSENGYPEVDGCDLDVRHVSNNRYSKRAGRRNSKGG